MSYIIRGTDVNDKLKFIFANTTTVVDEARKIHDTSMTSSALLGRVLTIGAMMSTNMKNVKDTMTIIINGDGPAGRTVVVSSKDGTLKGFMDNPHVELPIRDDGKIDVRGAVGKGNITITMDLGLKEPYSTSVPIVDGEIGTDIANYLYTSDQVPSVVGVGVLVDKDLSIKASGGFIIQLLPGYTEEDIDELEKCVSGVKSVTEMIDRGLTPEKMAEEVLKNYELKVLEKEEISFNCDCSKERVENALTSLGEEELKQMIEEDGQAEVHCYFCNKKYLFTGEELENIIEKIK